MSHVATLVFVMGIAGLFYLTHDKKAHTSIFLWAPVMWFLICESRPVSEWFQSATGISSEAQYLDGSPTDRLVFVLILGLAILQLALRVPKVKAILRGNLPIVLFFAYCGISICWSDFPAIAFKRWIKALGDLCMILVILTDPNWKAAFKRTLTRTAFIIIPVSVLFIKYYPDLGRMYLTWVWTPVYVGVTTNKNTLGMVAMLLSLGILWCFLQTFLEPRSREKLRALIAYSALLLMAGWVLWMAGSATSWSCFLLGGGILTTTRLSKWFRKPTVIHLMVVGAIAVSASALFLNAGDLLKTMGRDPTLTGRTEIWHLVIGMDRNPILGTGFESFWLGKRLEYIWNLYWWHPNEAHDGYLEVYLNLGWVGITFLGMLIVSCYLRVVAACRRAPEGSLLLAYFVVTATYNLTEAAFRMLHPVWIFFLIATIAAPESVRALQKSKKAVALKPVPTEVLVPHLENA